MPVVLDERPDLRVRPRIGRALAEDRERALRRRQEVEGARDRFRRRGRGRRRVDDLDQRLLRALHVERGAQHLGRQVEIDPARAPRHGGADRPRDADADVLRAVDAVGRLGKGPGGGELIHLLVIALLQIDDRAVARPADEDHRETVGRGVGQRDEAVHEAGGRNGHADPRLLRQIPGDRRRVPGRLLVPKTDVPNPLVLRQPQEIGDRDAGHPIDRIDPVQLQRLHHQVKAVGHLRRGRIVCAHIVHHSPRMEQGLMRVGPIRQRSRRSNRAKRRSARSRERTLRAMSAASAGAISPRDTAANAVHSACRTCSALRIDDRSIPRRSAGSLGGRGGGRSCVASNRSRWGLRSRRLDSACGLSLRAPRSGTRRLGLGMPRGLPPGLPELPLAKRPRGSRPRGKKRSGPSD